MGLGGAAAVLERPKQRISGQAIDGFGAADHSAAAP